MAAPALPEAIRAAVAEALVRNDWNVVLTSRETGVSENTIRKYMPPRPERRAAEVAVHGGPEPGRSVDEIVREAVAKALAAKAAEAEVVKAEPVKMPMPIPGKTKTVTPDRKYERIAFLSDIHHPFHDPVALKVVYAALRDYKPELLVIGGDGFDCYSISAHDREPGRMDCVQDEFDAAQPTWQELDSLGCDTVFIDGNHEFRINRLQHEKPGLFRLRCLELPKAAELPQRWMYYPNQTQLRIGSLTALHGDLRGRGSSVMHAAAGMLKKLRMSCIFGHYHRFQSFYEATADGTIRAGFANGHLCDINQATYITSPDWMQGFTTIDYDWSLGIFSVTPHLIVSGATVWNSKTYAG